MTNALNRRFVLGTWRWPWLAAGFAIALTLPSLWSGLAADDYIHAAMLRHRPGFTTEPLGLFTFVRAGDVEAAGRIALPWWSAPDLQIAFWRPVAALTHVLDCALWPDAPWLMHAQSIAWYAAAVLLVGWLFQRILGAGWIAGLAALAYAADPTHALSVDFIAGRNALVGVAFGAATLLLHDTWRRQRCTVAAWLAPGTFALGLLSNEGAIAIAAYLFAYALFLDSGALRSRLVSLAPYAMVAVVWQCSYHALGYGTTAAYGHVDPVRSPSPFLHAMVMRTPAYLVGQWLLPSENVFVWLPQIGFTILVLLAAAVVGGLAGLLWPLIRTTPATRFWLAGMMLALVPACTGSGDRMLVFTGIGAAALVAQLAGTLAVRRLGPRLVVGALVALHLCVASVWLPIRVVATGETLAGITTGVRDLALRPDIGRKCVVLINDFRFASYFAALRSLEGLEPVEQVLVLAPASQLDVAIVLTRTADDTLVMDAAHHDGWDTDRGDGNPFVAGTTIRRPHVSIEVLRVEDGLPTRVSFHFDRSVDDPLFAWFAAPGDAQPWAPPPIGMSVTYPRMPIGPAR
ncbi:MAG: hypothetical protein U1E76_21440 [Planctomycetota bacterium]